MKRFLMKPVGTASCNFCLASARSQVLNLLGAQLGNVEQVNVAVTPGSSVLSLTFSSYPSAAASVRKNLDSEGLCSPHTLSLPIIVMMIK